MPPDALARVLASSALDSRMKTYLRPVEADREHAAYICGLRSDQQLNRYLNAPPTTVDDQLRWLEAYKLREAAGEEFYFVIVSDGQPVGVVRIYDFKPVLGIDSFSWGSFIIPPPRAPGLVTAVSLMIYQLGFDDLGFEQVHFEVRRGNATMLAFHDRWGARKIDADAQNFYFVLAPEAYRTVAAASADRIAPHRRPA